MAAAAETKPTAKDEPQDVLVYLDNPGALRCVWNDVKRAGFGGIIVGGHTIVPGLSFVPAALWPKVKASASWAQHTKAGAEGRQMVRAVAGDEGTLVAGWHALSPKDAIAWVAKSGHLETLERLHTLESTRRPSRPEVAQAIDAQLRKVRELGSAQ